MNSLSPEHKAACRQVRALLTQLYGESARADTCGPVFWLAYGSPEVGISIDPLSGQRGYVRIFAWVVTGPRVDEELMEYLLRSNRNMRLGAFAVDEPATSSSPTGSPTPRSRQPACAPASKP